MTNAELAALLNEELGLVGVEIVSANVVRQWVAWDVLPKAAARGRSIGSGPVWSRSDDAMQQAYRLAELRRAGVKRETAVIVQAYIEWGHSDWSRVLDALQNELGRARSLVARRRTTKVDQKYFRELSVAQKRAISNQIGPLDIRFKDTRFRQSDELYAMITKYLESGEGEEDYIHNLILEAADSTFPGIRPLMSPLIRSGLLSAFKGIFGEEAEIGSVAGGVIWKASEQQLDDARTIFRAISSVIWPRQNMAWLDASSTSVREAFEMLARLQAQISIGRWAAVHLVGCLLFVLRGGNLPEIKVNSADAAEFLGDNVSW